MIVPDYLASDNQTWKHGVLRPKSRASLMDRHAESENGSHDLELSKCAQY